MVGVGMAVGVAVLVAVWVAVGSGVGVAVAVAVGGSVAVGVGANTAKASGVAVAMTTPALSTSCILRVYWPAAIMVSGKRHCPLAATCPSPTTLSPNKRRTVAPGSPCPLSWVACCAARPRWSGSISACGGTTVFVGVGSGLTTR